MKFPFLNFKKTGKCKCCGQSTKKFVHQNCAKDKRESGGRIVPSRVQYSEKRAKKFAEFLHAHHNNQEPMHEDKY